MKKILSIMFCLCAIMAVQAQVIEEGDMFWDGQVLYTVSEIRLGKIVYMQGVDASGNDYELTLEKVGKKAGNYKLIPSRQAEEPPFRCTWNSSVTYVRKNGMYFLAVKNASKQIVETLLLTPDNLENNIAHQEEAQNRTLASMASGYLMNKELTSHFSTAELKKYINKLSRKKSRTVIEDTNLQLMKSEIQSRK